MDPQVSFTGREEDRADEAQGLGRPYWRELVLLRHLLATSSLPARLLSRYVLFIRPGIYSSSQMYIGDGAKLVRDAFELAKEKAPAIIFIDELDAIGTKRFDSDKSGDREVQRTMLELLNQLDGFSSDSRIKVTSNLHGWDALICTGDRCDE